MEETKSEKKTRGDRLHFVFITKGSRGDVQPVVLIAQELMSRDHRVTIATHEAYQKEIRDSGIGFAPIPGDPVPYLRSKEGQDMLAQGESRAFVAGLHKCFPLACEEIEAAVQDADVIVTVSMSLDVGYTLAEKLAKPMIRVNLQPITPTRTLPSIFVSSKSIGGTLNALTHMLSINHWHKCIKDELNAFREKKGMKPITNAMGVPGSMMLENVPQFIAISPSIWPRPADFGAHMQVTGFLFPKDIEKNQGLPVPDGLEEFLSAGPKPVYFGFGSMPAPPQKLMQLVLDTVREVGCRAVVCAGWSKMDNMPELPESVFMCAGAPHAWLFPRCAAVVHHGGAGTTAAGVRAGVPAVICPLFADQPFWARQLHAVGVAAQPLQFHTLTSAKLAAAVQSAIGEEMTAEAAKIGASVREEGTGAEQLADMMELYTCTADARANIVPRRSATTTCGLLSRVFSREIKALAVAAVLAVLAYVVASRV